MLIYHCSDQERFQETSPSRLKTDHSHKKNFIVSSMWLRNYFYCNEFLNESEKNVLKTKNDQRHGFDLQVKITRPSTFCSN